MFYRILRNAVFIAFLFVHVHGECQISLRSDVRVFKEFGSRYVQLQKEAGDVLELSENDGILVICSTKLSLETPKGLMVKYKSLDQGSILLCNHKLELKLQKNSTDEFEPLHSHEVFLSCDHPKRYLFESHIGWPNCRRPLVSYSVARSDPGFSKAMGFCYDFDNRTLKFANYHAYYETFYERGFHEHQDYLHVHKEKKLTDLKTYFDFMSHEAFNSSFHALKSKHRVLDIYEFDLANLIQDKPMDDYVHDFDYILNIVWWRNLRLGNWRHYLEALLNRVMQTQDYFVYTGTHGIIELPTLSSDSSEQMTFATDKVQVHAPEYIWSYLQSLNETNSEDEAVVIIAHNSPFFAEDRKGIFCEDICDRFDWLTSGTMFGKLRLLPTMGVVFCCRPEDVVDKFKPFPYLKSDSEILINLFD